MCLGDAKLSVARRSVHLFRDLVSSCCLSLFTNSCFWNLLHSCHPSADSEIVLPASCLCFSTKLRVCLIQSRRVVQPCCTDCPAALSLLSTFLEVNRTDKFKFILGICDCHTKQSLNHECEDSN